MPDVMTRPRPKPSARRATPTPWWRKLPWGRRLVPLLIVEAAVLVLGAVAAFLLWPDTTPHPERVATAVQACDTTTKGSAQVTFTVNNGDRASHNYQVHVVVMGAGGTKQLGAANVLVNHVDAGATATGRALVALAGDSAGASCLLRAEVFTGDFGHHS